MREVDIGQEQSRFSTLIATPSHQVLSRREFVWLAAVAATEGLEHKGYVLTLVVVAQLVRHHFVHRKMAGSIPGQSTSSADEGHNPGLGGARKPSQEAV